MASGTTHLARGLFNVVEAIESQRQVLFKPVYSSACRIMAEPARSAIAPAV
jgi:hypothetical protein